MHHSDESDPMHSHHLYITSWDGKAVHVHGFKGVTSFDVGHNHRYAGTTEAAASGVQHIHRYFTFTSLVIIIKSVELLVQLFSFQTVGTTTSLVESPLLMDQLHIDTDIVGKQVVNSHTFFVQLV